MVPTAYRGDRVVLAHSIKCAATPRERHAGENPVLLHFDTKARHAGGKPVSTIIREQADEWALMCWNMDINYQ